jgi:hypothetical protein
MIHLAIWIASALFLLWFGACVVLPAILAILILPFRCQDSAKFQDRSKVFFKFCMGTCAALVGGLTCLYYYAIWFK